jgi:hypothetical protein
MEFEAGREEPTDKIEPQGDAHGRGEPAGRSRSVSDRGGDLTSLVKYLSLRTSLRAESQCKRLPLVVGGH